MERPITFWVAGFMNLWNNPWCSVNYYGRSIIKLWSDHNVTEQALNSKCHHLTFAGGALDALIDSFMTWTLMQTRQPQGSLLRIKHNTMNRADHSQPANNLMFG
jgi:hypothetical protein